MLRALGEARFDAVVCPALLRELRGVLGREKFAHYFSPADVDEFAEWLSRAAVHAPDPAVVEPVSPDATDD